MSFPELYLLRHGQTEWNVQGRLQGRKDSALTPLGLAQARRQARLLQRLPAGLPCFSSPAGRATATARIAFGARAFATDDRLHEIDIGPFAGLTQEELRAAHPQVFTGAGIDWYDRVPGGEDFALLQQRVNAFLADLQGPAIIMTHGVTLRMIRLVAMQLPLARLAEMPVLQGALHQVRAGAHQIIF